MRKCKKGDRFEALFDPRNSYDLAGTIWSNKAFTINYYMFCQTDDNKYKMINLNNGNRVSDYPWYTNYKNYNDYKFESNSLNMSDVSNLLFF